MDWLDRVNEHMEKTSPLAYHGPDQTPQPEQRMPPKHEITIIGVIRGVDGWYRCGFDEATKTVIPLEKLERAENV